MYQTGNVNDLEKIYSILRKQNPKNQVDVVYDYNKKIYTITPSDKLFETDPDIPVDLKIEVVYGDSVVPETPLLLKNKNDNNVTIRTIDSIVDQWHEYPEFKILDSSIRISKNFGHTDYQVWCDKGWADIVKVIRHKTNKRIYNVMSHTGVVNVTEDHSLCDIDGNKIKPIDVTKDQKLLHSFPSTFNECDTLSLKEARIYGAFAIIGSLFNQSLKTFLTFESSNLLFLIDIQQQFYELYGYKLKHKATTLILENPPMDIIRKFKDFYSETSNYKTIPDKILNATKDIKHSFLCGMSPDNNIKRSYILCDTLLAQCIYYISSSLGIQLSIDSVKNDYIYMSDIDYKDESKYCIRQLPSAIKSTNITKYVYDLETIHGRFNAGIGQMTISNTDSCFLKYKYNRDDYVKNRNDTFRLGTICGERLTNDVFARPPIEMEFEKVFQPFILLTKKRYIGKKYEDTSDPLRLKGIDAKGIALTRRDYSSMVKKCYKEVIDVITKSDDTKDIINGIRLSTEIYKQYVDRIVSYDISIQELETSATLAKEYSCSICKKKCEWSNLRCVKCKKKNIDRTKACGKCNAIFECVHVFSLAHVNLATKLLQRREEINVNDRIPFVYIESDNPRDKKADLAETPRENLKFNRVIYLEQLAKTLLGFFKIVLNDHRDLLNDIIDYTNVTLEALGSKKLKPSDFIQGDDL